MLIPLGILAAAGSGAGAMELITTTTLSSVQSSVTFSGIPQDYTHLQVRISAKSTDSTAGGTNLRIQSNLAIAAQQQISTIGSGIQGGLTSIATEMRVGGVPRSNGPESFGFSVTDILNYSSTTKNKTTRSFSGYIVPATILEVAEFTHVIESSSPLNLLTFTPSTGQLAIGSRFSLYGIRGDL
jgi:hypothetical protein